MNGYDENSSGLLDYCWFALQAALIALKLCRVISWSWWIVLLPALIPIGLVAVALLVAFIAIAIEIAKEKRGKKS